jgi:predicted nucleotidyltransferase
MGMEEKKFFEKNEKLNDLAEIEKEIEKLRDPTVHASIMYAVLRERESTNLILKNLLQRIEKLEEKIIELESKRLRKVELSDIDKAIISYAKMKESHEVTAKEIQKIFNYRKRNAACARLSRLSDLGYFERKKVSKEVYYVLSEATEEK